MHTREFPNASQKRDVDGSVQAEHEIEMLPSQRALFNIPRNVCYLNAASWSPLPIAAQEAGPTGVARKGQPWLIDPAFAKEQHERARRAAAKVINADPEDVALISSVSYGVATAAKTLNASAATLTWAIRRPRSHSLLFHLL